MTEPTFKVVPVHAEHPSSYKPQGLHPVHLGDSFADGRYTVTHKLGHGKSSTIWVVHDAHDDSLKSLKIIAAWKSDTEVQVLQHLEANFDEQEEGSQHVARMFDAFIHEGPNGKHQCIVGEILGPDLGSYVGDYWETDCFPPDMVRRLFGQTALGVRYLHQRGVVHGDLHQGNVLLRLPMDWGSLEKELDKPEKYDYGPDSHSPHRPKYLVSGIGDNYKLLRLCLQQPYIKITDFSESIIPALPDPPLIASPLVLRPPEALLGFLKHATIQSDIWALAVLCHMLFCNGLSLFHYGDMMLHDIVLNLGKFPEPWWSSWAGHKDFDEDGRAIRGPTKSIFLKFKSSILRDAEEGKALKEMLRAMVRYDATSRITAEQVLASEWVQTYCRPQMKAEVKFVVENIDGGD
ncbi:Protein kinase [Mycena indigotica]|uniref:Protein kinase n=1 Tax=Mycena indigotica TaxID=2126181 RepID=A0A8H6WIK0_9AGAR|nr:Protein kinase [Mycena indigotica]KAF7316218.1 Protein kinase [Mycena indigotica]